MSNTMAEGFDLLETVKAGLGVTGAYHDALLAAYIDEVKSYLLYAGVPKSLIGSKPSAGVITRGVADLWNYGAGAGTLSPYFHERVVQLAKGGVM